MADDALSPDAIVHDLLSIFKTPYMTFIIFTFPDRDYTKG